MELALIDKIMDDSRGRIGIDGQRYGEVRRSRCDEEGSRIWKHVIKFNLKVKKLKRAKIRRDGVVSRCEDSCHTRRKQGRVGSRGGVVEEKILELERGEQTITIEIVLRKSVMAGFGTKESKVIGGKSVQISFTDEMG